MGRHHQQLVAGPPIGVLEKIEYVEDILAHVLVIGEEREIRIQTRGFFIEIAGTDMRVVTQGVALATLDQQQLAVHLEPGNAENHVDAVFSQALSPTDIGRLVKARRQFHRRQHFLAIVHRVNQRIDYSRIPRHTVQANLDRAHLRVQRRCLQQIHNVVEGMVGIVEEHVLFPDRVENAARRIQPRNADGRLHPELKVLRPHSREIDKILGIVVATARDETVVLAEAEARAEKIPQARRHPVIVNHTHRVSPATLLQTERHFIDQAFPDAGIDVQFRIP